MTITKLTPTQVHDMWVTNNLRRVVTSLSLDTLDDCLFVTHNGNVVAYLELFIDDDEVEILEIVSLHKEAGSLLMNHIKGIYDVITADILESARYFYVKHGFTKRDYDDSEMIWNR